MTEGMGTLVVHYREPLFVLVVAWIFGLIVLFVVSELVMPGVVRGPRLRRILGYSAVALALVLSIWPILSAVVMLMRHEYLLGLLPLLYGFPYCLGLAFLARPLIRLVKLYRTCGLDAVKARLESWGEMKRRNAPTDEQYADSQDTAWRQISKVFTHLSLVFILPTVFLKIALGTVGAPVSWWPDFEPASFFVYTLLSYIVARARHPAVALAISTYLFLLKLYEVVSRFETQDGVLRILSYKKHQVRLSAIIFAALIMVGCCGCIHYCISLLNPSAYSRPLSTIDSLYFSVTTFATVGYGDIYPRTDLAKLVCIGEIISGCLVLVFGVNLAMTVWFQKFADAKAGPAEVSTAAKQLDAKSVSSSGASRAK